MREVNFDLQRARFDRVISPAAAQRGDLRIVAALGVCVFAMNSFVGNLSDEILRTQASVATAPALVAPKVVAPKACGEVPAERVQFAKNTFALAELGLDRYVQYAAGPGSVDSHNDKIISMMAKDTGLTVVPYIPFHNELFQQNPNIKRDFTVSNNFLKKNYGVQISPLKKRIGDDPGPGINPFDKRDKKTMTPMRVRTALGRIVFSIHKYPKQFIQAIGLKNIVVGIGAGVSGQAESKTGTVFMAADAEGVVDHELFHTEDDKECKGIAYNDPGYTALNPPDFSYDQEKNTVMAPSISQAQIDKQPELEEQSFTYSEYGKTNVVEDKADQGARLIGGRAFEILQSKSTIVKEKFFYLAGRMASTKLGERFVRYFALAGYVYNK